MKTISDHIFFPGLFAIIGLATPNWHNEVVSSSKIQSQINAHHGLWAKCSFRGADNFDCGAHSSEKGKFIKVNCSFEVYLCLLQT